MGDVRDRPHALEVAAAAISRAQGLDAMPVFRALWRREQAGSHCDRRGTRSTARTDLVAFARPTTLFMRTRPAITFDAPDGKPVSQLLVILVPEDGANDNQLQLLVLVPAVLRSRLSRATDATATADAFRIGIARLTAKPRSRLFPSG